MSIFRPLLSCRELLLLKRWPEAHVAIYLGSSASRQEHQWCEPGQSAELPGVSLSFLVVLQLSECLWAGDHQFEFTSQCNTFGKGWVCPRTLWGQENQLDPLHFAPSITALL